jgi:hypothetical protein
MLTTADRIKCLKFTRSNNEWAIIAHNDDFLAKQFYMQEYKINEKTFKKEVRVEKISYNYKVNNFLFQKAVPIGSVINMIKFFPRVVADSDEE